MTASSCIFTAWTISSFFYISSTSFTDFYFTIVSICSSSYFTSSTFFVLSSSSLRLASITIFNRVSSSSSSCFLCSSICIEALRAASKSAYSSLRNSGSTSFYFATSVAVVLSNFCQSSISFFFFSSASFLILSSSAFFIRASFSFYNIIFNASALSSAFLFAISFLKVRKSSTARICQTIFWCLGSVCALSQASRNISQVISSSAISSQSNSSTIFLNCYIKELRKGSYFYIMYRSVLQLILIFGVKTNAVFIYKAHDRRYPARTAQKVDYNIKKPILNKSSQINKLYVFPFRLFPTRCSCIAFNNTLTHFF